MDNSVSLNEDDLRDILNGMVEGIVTINDSGIILSFNKSAETIFEYDANEAIGQNVSMLMPQPDSGRHDGYLSRYMSTHDAHIIGIGRHVTAMKKSGKCFPLHLSISEYPAKISGERWFIGSCLDMTLQKQQEEQLNRSLKMEAIGKLTGGIAHDYNNMLGVIFGYTELLSDEIKDNPISLQYIEQIKYAAQRGAELTKSLLSFSGNKPDSELIIINDVLKRNFKMLEKTLSVSIRLDMSLDDNLWPVYISEGCLEDAILNISINAMHAMPEGGVLEYKTTNIHVGTLDSQILDIDKGDYIKLSILDDGIGMTKEVSSHIFEPFFTTKGEKGTGLGLSQVYNFVNNFDGGIRVYSELGHGTCFSIYLPRYSEPVNKDNNNEKKTYDKDELIGTGNILVVDDEITIRELTQKILTSKGYDVFCAKSGEEALSILKDIKIDLLLSDVIMPVMDGYELAHMVHHIYPDIKVQLCSGFSKNEGKSVTNTALVESILHKPFTSEELLKRVKELLSN